MKLWRICKEKHASAAFSGAGAEKAGGRWNFKGYPLVYASENLSLAALELFVHVPPGLIPADLVAICGELPDTTSAETIDLDDLPVDWRSYPAPVKLQLIGIEWLKCCSSAILKVPSAINPLEFNLLLNPLHPESKKLKVTDSLPFHFDPRMFGK